MKKTLLAIGLAAISAAAVAQPNGVPTSGLLAYYNFNSDLESHNGWHNLTWGGTEGTYVPGRPNAGEACLLNGTHLIGSMAVPLTIPTGDFTIAGWIKLENAVPNGSYPTLMEWDESLFLRLFSQQGGTVLSQQGGYLSTGGGFAVAEGGFVVNPNTQWMHFAMTQANGTLTLYQSGVVVAEISVSGNAQSNGVTGLIVGGGTNGGVINAIKYLNGAIDDLFIYNRGLSLEEIQTVYNSTDCNLGTVTLVAGTDICANDQETTLFQAGTGGTTSIIRYVSNGGTGGPAGGDMAFSQFPHPHTISQVQNFYTNNPLVGSWLVFAYDPFNPNTCSSEPVEVNFLPAGDPSCYDCSVGLLVSEGASFCPHESIQVQSWADASTNPGGILTFELIPLEGQGDGIPLSSYTYPIFGSFTIPGGHSFQGQYSIELKMYYAGESVPCATESVTINFLPESDVQCTCEIGNLLVNNGAILCPGEHVILEAGSVQLPEGRVLRFEIFDFPDYETYEVVHNPFDAPYTFTHDGTYFGEAVFYVYAGYSGGGGGPVLPEEVTTRGGGNDICGSYEVFVTLAQSTDAECLTIGISDLGTSAISVHPNPTEGLLTLNGVTSGTVIEVIDVTGKRVATFAATTDHPTIDLAALTSGIYTLRMANASLKVVKF